MNHELKKLFVKTNGCQMNEYDANKMRDVLVDRFQFEMTNDPESADILLLNTCSIREKAQEKVFSQVGEWRLLKNKKPHVIIGVGGCVASQEGENIIKRAPFVDLVFGPQTLHRLPEMLSEHLKTKRPVIDVSFPEIEKFDKLPEPRAEGPTAFVSIMEGCSKYCSYCIVPYTRGEEISRPLDDVLIEVATLASQGVKEINFLGQNVNDYRGPTHDGSIADLAALIHYAANIENIDRIRFTTSHPLAFADNLIDTYAQVPQLVSHLHLPVQSGSDRILLMMKRGYNRKLYLQKIESLKKVRPDIKISSDFIIGFPGETDADFQATLDLIDEVQFDQSFSFIFSARPGTPAAQYPDDIPMNVKKERLQILQAKLNQYADQYSENLVGTTQKILVTKQAKKNQQELSGRTECNRVVNFPGQSRLLGHIIDVDITEARPNSLRGEITTA